MTSSKALLLAAILTATATPVSAQFSLPGMGGLGGLSGISSMGMGNAAGVLSYCLQNQLLGGGGGAGGASSVLSSLTHKPGVAGSPGFTAGQAGNILGGNGGTALSLGSLSGDLKSQACNMVLKQAKTFL